MYGVSEYAHLENMSDIPLYVMIVMGSIWAIRFFLELCDNPMFQPSLPTS